MAQQRAVRYFTSKAVERETDISGTYLRLLVQQGVIKPEKDSSGRNLYTRDHIRQVKKYRSKR